LSKKNNDNNLKELQTNISLSGIISVDEEEFLQPERERI
jgi:hypothetical protein